LLDMNIAEDIMTQNYKWIKENDTLEKALSLFDKSTDVLLVIDNNKNYSGILTEKMILRSGLERINIKVRVLRTSAPRVSKSTSVMECAQLMLESDVLNLPVFENDALVGVVDDMRLLNSVVLKKFGKKKIKNYISKDMIIVSPRDKISQVLKSFREFHISRMPVVDNGKIVGIVTLHDIISKLINPKKRASFDFILDEKRSLLDFPVEKVMSYPFFTCNKNADVQDVISMMSDNDVSSIIIVDDLDRLSGIVTKRDLLEPISEEKVGITYPFIQINSKIKDLDRNKLTNLILQFIDKYRRKFKDSSFHVYFGEHKEKSSGKHLIYVRCRINSSYGRFAVTGEGWGSISALENALINLDKQIVRKISKERKLERSYRRELMDYVEIESLT